tara:strand:- start:175 stop:327 length:153 start_codon:yes stop_codon:yes gene_type:complete
MNKEKNNPEEEFEQPSFLNQAKLKKQEDKIESGETTCSTHSPEDCESCSG